MTEQLTLTAGNGSVTGLLARGETGRPLLVCIPGGSYNARYFDVPGHSFVRAAIERGFSVAALNRPGYEDSTPLSRPSLPATRTPSSPPSMICGRRPRTAVPEWYSLVTPLAGRSRCT